MVQRPEAVAAWITLVVLAVLPSFALGGTTQRKPPPAANPAPGQGLPPLSLVRAEEVRREGNTSAVARVSLYSRNLNRPLCASSEVRGDIYVGTPLGLKVMRRAPKTGKYDQARLYTTRDGLPSDYVVQVQASNDGVWCVALTRADGGPVRAEPGGAPTGVTPFANNGMQISEVQLPAVTLCYLDQKADRWKVLKSTPLGEIRPSQPAASVGMPRLSADSESDGFLGERAAVAVTDELICFAPGRTNGADDVPLLFLLDRKNDHWTEVRAESGLNPAQESMLVSSLDVRGQRVFLGTNKGMLCYDREAGDWSRYLPDYEILARASSGDSDGMQLIVRQREPKNTREAMWRLLRFDPIHPTADVGALLPVVNGDAPGAGRSPTSLPERAAREEPIGVTVDRSRKMVWVTTLTFLSLPGSNEISQGLPFRPVPPLASRLYRYDLRRGVWSRYAVFPEPPEWGTDRSAEQRFYTLENAQPAARVVLPPDAVRPLALCWNGRNDAGVPMAESVADRFPLDTPGYWRRRFFPAWQSAPALLPKNLFQMESGNSVADSFAAGIRWSVENGRIVRKGRTPGERRLWSPAGKMVRYRPTIQRISTTGIGGSDIVAFSKQVLFTLNPRTGEYRPIPLPALLAPEYYGGARDIAILPAAGNGSDSSLLLHRFNKPFLLQYDLKTKILSRVGNAPRNSHIVGLAGPGAVWMRVEDLGSLPGFVRVRATEEKGSKSVSGTPAVIRVPMPPAYPTGAPRPDTPIATSRNMLWFAFYVPESHRPLLPGESSDGWAILGYDTRKTQWLSEPLRLPRSIDDARPGVLLPADPTSDDLYVAARRTDGSVFRFDAATGQWSPLIPALPPLPPPSSELPVTSYWRRLKLISVTPEEVWLAAQSSEENAAANTPVYLLHFDRRKGGWTAREELPEELQPNLWRGGEDMDFAMVGTRIVVRHQTRGLRVFHPATHHWSAPTTVAKLSSTKSAALYGGSIYFSLHDVYPGRDAIWATLQLDQGTAPLVARLDLQTGQWRFWGGENLEDLNSELELRLLGGIKITPDGNTAWLRTPRTLRRYVPTTKDWEVINPAGTDAIENNPPSVYPDTEAVWLLGGRRRKNTRLAKALTHLYDPNASEYVLWRWDRCTGAYDAYPMPEPSTYRRQEGFLSPALSAPLSEKDALLLATNWELLVFDKRARRWSILPLPEGVPPVPALRLVRGKDGALYIVNDSQVVRYEILTRPVEAVSSR